MAWEERLLQIASQGIWELAGLSEAGRNWEALVGVLRGPWKVFCAADPPPGSEVPWSRNSLAEEALDPQTPPGSGEELGV